MRVLETDCTFFIMAYLYHFQHARLLNISTSCHTYLRNDAALHQSKVEYGWAQRRQTHLVRHESMDSSIALPRARRSRRWSYASAMDKFFFHSSRGWGNSNFLTDLQYELRKIETFQHTHNGQRWIWTMILPSFLILMTNFPLTWSMNAFTSKKCCTLGISFPNVNFRRHGLSWYVLVHNKFDTYNIFNYNI